MSEKILKVTRCSRCYHAEKQKSEGRDAYFCMHKQVEYDIVHTSGFVLSNRIPYVKGIPYWCPLENWPEK